MHKKKLTDSQHSIHYKSTIDNDNVKYGTNKDKEINTR